MFPTKNAAKLTGLHLLCLVSRRRGTRCRLSRRPRSSSFLSSARFLVLPLPVEAQCDGSRCLFRGGIVIIVIIVRRLRRVLPPPGRDLGCRGGLSVDVLGQDRVLVLCFKEVTYVLDPGTYWALRAH